MVPTHLMAILYSLIFVLHNLIEILDNSPSVIYERFYFGTSRLFIALLFDLALLTVRQLMKSLSFRVTRADDF